MARVTATHQLNQPEIGFIDPSRFLEGDDTSHLSAEFYNAVKSQEFMDNFLLAHGYTVNQVSQLTTNDKIYAIRLLAAQSNTPVVVSISPTSVAYNATTTDITITGSNFTAASGVKFGTKNASTFTVSNDNTIVARIPTGLVVGDAGSVAVTVVGSGGTSNATVNITYTAS